MSIKSLSLNTPQHVNNGLFLSGTQTNKYGGQEPPKKTSTSQSRNNRNVHTYTDQDFSYNQKNVKTEFSEKPQQINNYFHKPSIKNSSIQIEHKKNQLQKALKQEKIPQVSEKNTYKFNDQQYKIDPNITIHLLYKRQKILCKFNITNKNSYDIKTMLKNDIFDHELNNLRSSQKVALEEVKKIIGFQSANKNVQITYILSLNHKLINLFENATLSLEPIYVEKPQYTLNNNKQVGLKDFKFIKCIGLGGFSRVYLVSKKDSDQMYAMKLLDKDFILKNKKEGIVQNERNIMVKMDHPFLLKLDFSFETKNYLVFITEYCNGGEMFFHLRRIKKMNEDQARFYFTEICLGIDHLHTQSIIYRDIKPENILLDHEGHIRIGDFGLAKPDMDINEFAYSFCGSPEYMPPEMLMKVGHTYPVDYYCLGALLYELVTGLPPFYSHDTEEIYQSILSEELSFPSHAQNLSSDIKNLMRGLLVKHPMNRVGMQGGVTEIFNHPWFKKINLKDIMEKKIEPPIKPDILAFNFDEDEFNKGELEFRKKLIACQNDMEEEKAPKVFKVFYYESVRPKQRNFSAQQPGSSNNISKQNSLTESLQQVKQSSKHSNSELYGQQQTPSKYLTSQPSHQKTRPSLQFSQSSAYFNNAAPKKMSIDQNQNFQKKHIKNTFTSLNSQSTKNSLQLSSSNSNPQTNHLMSPQSVLQNVQKTLQNSQNAVQSYKNNIKNHTKSSSSMKMSNDLGFHTIQKQQMVPFSLQQTRSQQALRQNSLQTHTKSQAETLKLQKTEEDGNVEYFGNTSQRMTTEGTQKQSSNSQQRPLMTVQRNNLKNIGVSGKGMHQLYQSQGFLSKFNSRKL